jgi:hypothetical protein
MLRDSIFSLIEFLLSKHCVDKTLGRLVIRPPEVPAVIALGQLPAVSFLVHHVTVFPVLLDDPPDGR